MSSLRYWLGALGFILAVVYFASGFYVVNADEHAVVRRFGAIQARDGPGMHYRLPWPVDRVDVLKTTSVVKTGVGFTLRDNDPESLKGVELLTGDTNILNIALIVQYVIRNPADYLFQVDGPQTLVGTLAESVLTETVVGMPIDEVLTELREDLGYARGFEHVDADAEDHRRAPIISAFMSRTAASSPVKIARPMMQWPMLSSTISAIEATGMTLL